MTIRLRLKTESVQAYAQLLSSNDADASGAASITGTGFIEGVALYALPHASALLADLARVSVLQQQLNILMSEAVTDILGYTRGAECLEDAQAAYAAGIALTPLTLQRDAFQIPVTTCAPDPNAQVVDIKTVEVGGGGGIKVVDASGDLKYTVQTMKAPDGRIYYEVTLDTTVGVGPRLGKLANASEGVEGKLTWDVPTEADVQNLEQALLVDGISAGMSMATLHLPIVPVSLPTPHSVGVGDYVTGGGGLGEGANHAEVQGTISTMATVSQGGAVGTVSTYDLTAGAGLAVGGVGGISGVSPFGIQAEGSVQADLSASVTTDGLTPDKLTLEGSLTTTGSVTVPGHPPYTAPGGQTQEIKFSAEVDLRTATSEVLQAVHDLEANPADAQQALHTLMTKGVTIDYSVFQGTSQSQQVDIGVANANESTSDLHLVASKSFVL